MAAQLKASKRDILDFIEVADTVTPVDLVQEFGYTLSYAYKRLSVLKRQRLVTIHRRGHWALTENGSRRLHYLSKKLGVLTGSQERDWHIWRENERQKPSEEQAIWQLEEDGLRPRPVNLGEHGATMAEIREVARLNREAALRVGLSNWDRKSLPESKTLQDFFDLMVSMSAQGRSWKEVSNEVERQFGASLGEESLKHLLSLFKTAVRNSHHRGQALPDKKPSTSPPAVGWFPPRR